LITAADMAPRLAAAAAPPAYAPTPILAPAKRPSKPRLNAPGLVPTLAATPAFRERLLLTVLYLATLGSSVAFIEPSPNDAMVGILAVVCLICGVRFERSFTLPMALLLTWNVAGMIALINSYDAVKSVQSTVTLFYMAVAAMIFASVYADNTLARINVTRAGYIPTAVVAAFCGAVGYLHLLPGFDIFAPFGRALGMFKDPNVFGPFLIWPTLVIVERMMTKKITLIDLALVGTLFLGLLLSFSRGAWFHFSVSAAVMLAFSVLVAPNNGLRLRIATLTGVGIALLAVLLVILLSIPSIGGFFFERAQLLQSYDVGQGGRFVLQEIAVQNIFDFPGGLGPEEFSRIHGLQPHNVYLNVFMISGWAGGVSYILLLLTTLWMGWRTIFIRSPWQTYVIVTYATFVGEIAEGFIIDTDHWRHFFLLLGMVWGLGAANIKFAAAAHATAAKPA
jgi:hypothetical protein